MRVKCDECGVAIICEGCGSSDMVAESTTLPPNPTVRDIVRQYLEAEGYDGLWSERWDCACFTEDLQPCEFDDCFKCQAGYTCVCNDEDCEWSHLPDHRHINKNKPEGDDNANGNWIRD